MSSDYIVENDWVGGHRGEKKEYCKIEQGLTLKSIRVYYDDNKYYIRGITLTWSDNTTDEIGKAIRDGLSFFPEPDERFNYFILYNNHEYGSAERLGKIVSTTTLGHTFNPGRKPDGNLAHNMALGSGILLGMGVATDGDSILAAKPLFLKQYQSILSDVDLDLPTNGEGISPQDVKTWHFKSSDAEWSVEGEHEVTETSTWTQETESTFGVDFKVLGEIPGIVSVEGGFNWQRSSKQTHGTEHSEKTTYRWSLGGTLAKGQNLRVTAKTAQGVLEIPYTAEITITMKDGKELKYKEGGTYSNVKWADVDVVTEDEA
ncbi:uncharacterized protein DSM5745_02431 [Aspergillus mulundensis]|uniref:Jacalin-type lectin domain-containing protein n=1 Tax=Aspergillus mulundensis TaxID=1810919 RepID=A0A3D8SWH7_9EURO|nr:hypothetical protein DSM5745_02431 [Aspergillus mulundensis]RDW90656.1 hypothetical protein DSM5745_02431 [Aspergillus mulundensis]